jgi:hypothetical protein
MNKTKVEYRIVEIDEIGDAGEVNYNDHQFEAETIARNMTRDGRAVATVVEKVSPNGDSEIVAFFGDYAALRRGGWIRFANQAAA